MAKKRTGKPAKQTERLDQALAGAAITKLANGETPSRSEVASLRRYEKRVGDDLRNEHLAKIPKRWWVDASGRSTKELHRLADKWDGPFRGSTLDLSAIAAWLHSFIDRYRDAINRNDRGELKSDKLERLRKAQAEKVEMQNAIKRGELRHLDDVLRVLDFVASVYRKAAVTLKSEFGDTAYQIIIDAVGEANRVVAKFDEDRD